MSYEFKKETHNLKFLTDAIHRVSQALQYQYIYLHGFASSPNSGKARDIGDRFTQIDTNIKNASLHPVRFSPIYRV